MTDPLYRSDPYLREAAALVTAHADGGVLLSAPLFYPRGGTHVARTGEIGPVRIGKIEKKGRRNRRVTVLLGA
ncbi:Ser-tRNA(Ala) deacylase AlaX [Rhodovulum sulfidophilum]|nr:hypothetical protein A6W98_10130 [Rhodovulum sulfidophilum DSM 1374]ANB38224.1 hypothetical protein A6024_09990 [Rhodovulum sulfidophilum]MCW2302000.1 Ser-tRNA(Ala) deacylase AlaX [Rhodovulum sulfidophilum]